MSKTYKLIEVDPSETQDEFAINISSVGDKYIVFVEVYDLPPSAVTRQLNLASTALATILDKGSYVVTTMYNGVPSMKVLRLIANDPQSKFERLENMAVNAMEAANKAKDDL